MNRAWIPAGALAGVSVAGLLALGPLTDSMGTKVSFQPSVATVADPNSSVQLPVSIRLNEGVRGFVETKGGRQAPATNPDTGLVGFRKVTGRSTTRTTATHTTTTHATHALTPKKVVVKKAPKRQAGIGGPSSDTTPNSSSGLASGNSSSQSNTGETQSTLAGDGN